MQMDGVSLNINNSGIKRKSFDADPKVLSAIEYPSLNDENASANVLNQTNPKRLRFREALTSNMPMPVHTIKNTVTSSLLPRRFNTSSKSSMSSINTTSLTGGKTPTSQPQSLKINTPAASEKKRINTTTEINSAERERTPLKVINYNECASPLTPGSTIGFSSISNGLLRRLKKTVTRTASAEVIRNYFDCAFTVTEDKVNNILQNLKVKSKWDYKEKSKKQEVVIKELKDTVSTLLVEAKDLRDHCLTHESQVNALLRDSYDEFQESVQVINTFKTNENKLKKDLQRYQDELELTSSNMMKIKTDHSPLRHKVKDFELKFEEAKQQLSEAEAARRAAESSLEQISRELQEVKESHELEMQTAKEQFESVFIIFPQLLLLLLYNASDC